jgi:peptide/nickel transport system substrate-binding protein
MRAMIRLVVLALVAAACTGSTQMTTTTVVPVSTTTIPTTTTTAVDACPSVFCVIYEIDPLADWSDGQPVVAADFAHTLETMTGPQAPSSVNPGYGLVSQLRVLDDKTFLLAMTEVFAPWRTLFEIVLPAHAPHDPMAPGPTSGPFTLVEWVPGDRIVMARNPEYRAPEGMVNGNVDELRLVFPIDVRSMISDLSAGAVDVINPAPLGWMVEELAASEGVTLSLGPGPFWEHITFNHDDPILTQPWAREVFALALDRELILDATVRGIDPQAAALGNTIWMQGSPWYTGHVGSSPDPVRAEQILLDHSCERGDDGIYVCMGLRMSFIWATTVGDELRETQLALAAEQLEAIGVEIVPRLLTPSELFSPSVIFGPPGVWQVISFSWKASADPFQGDTMYLCAEPEGTLNVSRYCNQGVEELVLATRGELDQGERAGLYNEADRLYLEDHAVLPLYQKPMLLAWSSGVAGPRLNPGSTALWNVGSWTGKPTVVMALEDHPDALAPLAPLDDSSALVRSALYQGAFAVTPEYEFIPALVVAAETVVP